MGMVTAIIGGPLLHPADSEVIDPNLRVLKYPQLLEELRLARGRIVLVDCWMETCIPCKRGFPKVIAMQRKYAQDGLTTVTLCLTDPTDRASRERIRGFLRQQQSTGLNVLLDEPSDICQTKLRVDSVPCLFLFDRSGRLLHKWSNDEVDYDQIEQRVIAAIRSTP